MKDPYRQTLRIIKELEIPVDINEIEAELARLNEKEIRALLFKYQMIKENLDNLEKEAKKLNPKRYSKILAVYTQQLKEKTRERINKIEDVQEELDEKLDKEDSVAKDDFKKTLTKTDSVLNALNTLYKKFYSSLTNRYR